MNNQQSFFKFSPFKASSKMNPRTRMEQACALAKEQNLESFTQFLQNSDYGIDEEFDGTTLIAELARKGEEEIVLFLIKKYSDCKDLSYY